MAENILCPAGPLESFDLDFNKKTVKFDLIRKGGENEAIDREIRWRKSSEYPR